jgi:hypothetical protein
MGTIHRLTDSSGYPPKAAVARSRNFRLSLGGGIWVIDVMGLFAGFKL